METRESVAFEMVEEETDDSEIVEPLLKDIKIKDALMDRAYDAKSVFTYLKKKGVSKPGVR